MARRKVETRISEIDTALRNYKRELRGAKIDYDDAESRVLYYEDQIRRLKDAKEMMSKTKPKD